MGYRVGVDIGGTFTDFAILDDRSGELKALKVLSTPATPGQEVVDGLALMRERHGIEARDIVHFTHGTTVGVNTIIQRKGARLCLLTTENFGDVLELARLRMPETYGLFSTRPAPLIARDCVFPLAERILADGSVETPLDEASVERAAARARAKGCVGVVIALLHAYRNPAHERAAKAVIARVAPELFVFCSSEIWPVIREYERTTTVVLNAYVHPRIDRYLDSLQQALAARGVPAEPLITKSNGGVMRAELGKRDCVGMLLSGTASGVMGAAHVARAAGIVNALTLDIGGTSADVALVVDGRPQFGMGEKVGEFPLYVPTVSVSSIGEGGGSIASVDAFGVIRVGPESAGSDPGPACYGRGGTRATITDAFAVCGFLGEERLGYDAVTMDRAKAEAAVDAIADRLGRERLETAAAIIDVAISGMFAEINKMIAKHGVDVRDYALLTFGGAGPMMGCLLARELGMARVLVPTTPGVVSALGGLIADIRNDFVRTLFVDADASGEAAIRAAHAELERRALAWLREEQRFAGDYRLACFVDMAYRGQSFELEVPIATDASASGDVARIVDAFHREHERIYAFCDRAAPAHVVNLRVVIAGEAAKPALPRRAPRPGRAKPQRVAPVYLDGRLQDVAFYRRDGLEPGQDFDGPAVITQADTTTCVPAGFAGEVDALGNILLTLRR